MPALAPPGASRRHQLSRVYQTYPGLVPSAQFDPERAAITATGTPACSASKKSDVTVRKDQAKDPEANLRAVIQRILARAEDERVSRPEKAQRLPPPNLMNRL